MAQSLTISLPTLAAVVLVALFMAASILYRRSKQKPIFRPNFSSPLFLETWRSGRSLRNLLTRFGGARSCLWIAVADGQFRVAPHFPFTLMLLPEIYRAELAVPGTAIRLVKTGQGLFGNSVQVTFERSPGSEEVIEIWPRDLARFEAALAAIRASGISH